MIDFAAKPGSFLSGTLFRSLQQYAEEHPLFHGLDRFWMKCQGSGKRQMQILSDQYLVSADMKLRSILS